MDANFTLEEIALLLGRKDLQFAVREKQYQAQIAELQKQVAALTPVNEAVEPKSPE